MRDTRVVLALLAMALGTSPSAAAVADPDLPTGVQVTVRTYDSAGLAPAERLTAIAVATDILRAAGLDVEWQACEVEFVRSATDPCLAPLAASELSIRFVRLPPPPGHSGALALGYSLVDTRTRSGALATVYVDRVSALAARCKVPSGTLLGRTVAHEIGHLLLGTGNHGPTGLMQALWSREAIRGRGADKWLFTAREGRTMREAVRTRGYGNLQLGIRN